MPLAPIPFVPRTKFRPPRLPDDVLLRTRLLERLDRPATLTLIIAPAGYGKTTLAGTWLRAFAAQAPGFRSTAKTTR